MLFKQSIAILAHIVILRAFPETIRVLVVVTKSYRQKSQRVVRR